MGFSTAHLIKPRVPLPFTIKGVAAPFFCLIQKLHRRSVGKSQRLKTLASLSLSLLRAISRSLFPRCRSMSLSPRRLSLSSSPAPSGGGGDQIGLLDVDLVEALFRM
ncbi:hypothetical protein DY000_02021800 [Brassica cretica]|uniref:Uncharacterized protein n=1 Tax=Brassica cretica TaxID=69181 RepID=A0ABQ7E8F1_BRACR|nr:hypothetical protein DY000_02021800 [Brassica cretica]